MFNLHNFCNRKIDLCAKSREFFILSAQCGHSAQDRFQRLSGRSVVAMNGNSLDGSRACCRRGGQRGKVYNPYPIGLAELARDEEQLFDAH